MPLVQKIRTLEDAGTVIEPLVPWINAGVFMAATLGVATLDYMPWAIQNYAGVFFAMIWASTGIGIARLKAQDHPTSNAIPVQA